MVSDPWKECELIFDENEDHFIERMKERFYSGPSPREILLKGSKEPQSKKTESSQDFKITYGKWVIKCKLRKCNIVMGTIYQNK
jgi:hypothetical protein